MIDYAGVSGSVHDGVARCHRNAMLTRETADGLICRNLAIAVPR